MRTMKIGAVGAAVAAFIMMSPATAGATNVASGDGNQERCFQLPYFGPWGHASFDFGKGIVDLLNKLSVRVTGTDPIRAKGGNAGIYMPIGWKQDHIDPCRGVFYPGSFKLALPSGQSVEIEYLWLRPDGVYSNVTVNGKKWGERLVATYNLHEFLPFVATPRPLEGGVGPTHWPMYVAPDLSKAVDEAAGVKIKPGTYLGNLDAVVKFVPRKKS